MLRATQTRLVAVVWGPFHKSPKTYSGPGSKFSNCDPLIMESRSFNIFSRPEETKDFANFHVFSKTFPFEDTEGLMSPEIRLKSFGTFEKRAPGHTGPFCNGPVQDRKVQSQLFPRYKYMQNKHKGFQHGAKRRRELSIGVYAVPDPCKTGPILHDFWIGSNWNRLCVSMAFSSVVQG